MRQHDCLAQYCQYRLVAFFLEASQEVHERKDASVLPDALLLLVLFMDP